MCRCSLFVASWVQSILLLGGMCGLVFSPVFSMLLVQPTFHGDAAYKLKGRVYITMLGSASCEEGKDCKGDKIMTDLMHPDETSGGYQAFAIKIFASYGLLAIAALCTVLVLVLTCGKACCRCCRLWCAVSFAGFATISLVLLSLTLRSGKADLEDYFRVTKKLTQLMPLVGAYAGLTEVIHLGFGCYLAPFLACLSAMNFVTLTGHSARLDLVRQARRVDRKTFLSDSEGGSGSSSGSESDARR
mmetsp:Transcript_81584/g.205279  ORF Transcript_81584/g.205279 Transcript_81584/m.205279 type:complete len:245 (-) Transcript_81584:66-800(-)